MANECDHKDKLTYLGDNRYNCVCGEPFIRVIDNDGVWLLKQLNLIKQPKTAEREVKP